MAAPKGNKFWELRSKHGRDILFQSPNLLWEAACEYFQWCQNNPWVKYEQVKQPGKGYVNVKGKYIPPQLVIPIPTERPFTKQGLFGYLGCDASYFRKFKESDHKDFFPIITRIEEVIFQQKFEGAAVGVFNAQIISRDLGLIEKVENTNIEQPLFPDVKQS